MPLRPSPLTLLMLTLGASVAACSGEPSTKVIGEARQGEQGDGDDDVASCKPLHGTANAICRHGRKNFEDRKLHGLAANGRSCSDCHMPADSFQLSPQNVEARYQALLAARADNKNADDPLFRPIDADDFRVNGESASDFRNLRENGLVRVTIPLPSNIRLIDPATNAPSNETVADVWRSVPSVMNVKITGPDGQLPEWSRGPNTRGGYQYDARVENLRDQALQALIHHAQAQNAPEPSFLEEIEAYQQSLASSEGVRLLMDAMASGSALPDPDPELTPLEQQGKAVFKRACAQCHGGPTTTTSLLTSPPLQPIQRYHDINVSCPRPVDPLTPARFVFPPCPPRLARNARTYEITLPNGAKVRRTSTDPGRALLTGNANATPGILDDWQKFDVFPLYGISKTAPYFHDNSAATLEDVLDHYQGAFDFVKRVTNPSASIVSTTGSAANQDRPFTTEERPALLAYLKKL